MLLEAMIKVNIQRLKDRSAIRRNKHNEKIGKAGFQFLASREEMNRDVTNAHPKASAICTSLDFDVTASSSARHDPQKDHRQDQTQSSRMPNERDCVHEKVVDYVGFESSCFSWRER
jgi:hypothetical protein